MGYKIPVRLSNRHCHFTPETVKKLFGTEKLTMLRYLTGDDGPIACKETVILKGPKGEIHNVRLLSGPSKPEDQIEIMRGDNFVLGINAPLRLSGDLTGAGTVQVIGPAGKIELSALIVAKRHIHLYKATADELGLKHNQIIQVKTEGERGLIFDNVVVRITDEDLSVFHIDFEEANGAGLNNFDMVEIIEKSRE